MHITSPYYIQLNVNRYLHFSRTTYELLMFCISFFISTTILLVFRLKALCIFISLKLSSNLYIRKFGRFEFQSIPTAEWWFPTFNVIINPGLGCSYRFLDCYSSCFAYFSPPNSPPNSHPPMQCLLNTAARGILLKYIAEYAISLLKTSQFLPIFLSIKVKNFTVDNLPLCNLAPPDRIHVQLLHFLFWPSHTSLLLFLEHTKDIASSMFILWVCNICSPQLSFSV